MNILIVDDHATNRKLLRAQLEGEGHAILEAGDGVEALAVLDRDPVEAIISDILMPELDGFGLCLAVRRHGRHSTLPFILYTSTYTAAADMQLARTVGANQYLIKPAPVPALIAALRDAAYQCGNLGLPDQAIMLKQYNKALLGKMEDKENTLRQTKEQLARAHERITELNGFERKMQQWSTELAKVNEELHNTRLRLKELSDRPATCSCGQKKSEDQNYLQRAGDYFARKGSSSLSDGFLAETEMKQMAELNRLVIRNLPAFL